MQRGRALRVGIVGGGLMGCSAAIALAARGADVTIFEQAPGLLQKTAVASEAKIHLGYVYANDRGLVTARTMVKGALAFAPFYRRHLAGDFDFRISSPFYYPVHRDSLLSAPEVGDHLAAVHSRLAEAEGGSGAYFGVDLAARPEPLLPARSAEAFDPDQCLTVFRTAEVAIDSAHLAEAVSARIAQDPAIQVVLESDVRSVVAERGGHAIVADHEGTALRERFDHVINAAWAGRLAIDQTLGLAPSRPWLFRLKYGVHLPAGCAPAGLPSSTIVLGPFGDIVRHADDSLYLSWYPVCMTARSRRIDPPRWTGRLPAARRRRLVGKSLEALIRIMPRVSDIADEAVERAEVKGGVIFAWGRSDIDDRGSELHQRADIGITSTGHYHSVDPGKLTMVPWFADRCVDRIFG